ncbi:MAG: HD domain-containing protein, partial [Proteobacteria bacterium]|nr:HD domain-containing protein [Pseudomonadota bacterium]
IIISGSVNVDIIQSALSKGVFDFVPKPFTLQQIKEKIDSALNFCLNIRQSKRYFSHIESLLKERTEMLEQLAIQSVKALANAIEARDPYTRGHSERVAFVSTEIAKRLGYEEETLKKLELAGLLHDVGKVGIPDLILLKPGKLTDFEYMIMKNHPGMSALIVSEITPLNSIIPWIKHHHENFDGKGYPEGLKAKDIPMESRIIAIADNYDALSSLRPYRKKMAKEDVINYINSEFGKKFDPDLKEVSISVLHEIEELEEIKSSISPYIEKFREAMVYIDFLTGLYWYPYLKNFLKEKIQENQPFYLILIDIRGISEINKTKGRIKGDEIIIKTAHNLQSIFLPPSIVVRAGGDDFVVFDQSDLNEINKKINVLTEKLDKENIPFISKIVSFPENGSNFDELFSSFD